MNRRDFIGTATGVLAGGAIGGCASHWVSGGSSGTSAGAHQSMDAAAFHAARRFAETPFGRIAYVERGAGDTAIFLHGFPLNGFQWRGALDRLSAHHRCIAPDFLAMGYTEVAEGQSVAPDAQAEMLAALLDSLSIPAVDVVANDSGGAVAQLLVTRHARRVRTLLLTNCDTEHDSPPAALAPAIELAKAGTYADEWLVPMLADKELARSAEGLGGLCYSDPAALTDEAIEYYLAPLVSSPRRKARTHAFLIGLEPNALKGIEPLLRRSTVPTRIVWGTADTIFRPENPDYLDRVFGNSRGVRRLEGRKLFWPEVVPDILAEEARRLWNARWA